MSRRKLIYPVDKAVDLYKGFTTEQRELFTAIIRHLDTPVAVPAAPRIGRPPGSKTTRFAKRTALAEASAAVVPVQDPTQRFETMTPYDA
jgi:phage terminase large subunit-like protein